MRASKTRLLLQQHGTRVAEGDNMRKIYFSFMIYFVLASIGCQPSTMPKLCLSTSSPTPEQQLLKSSQINRASGGAQMKEQILSNGKSFGAYSISFQNAQQGIITGTEEHFWLTSDGGSTWEERKVERVESARKIGPYDLVKSTITSSGYIYALGHLEEGGSAIFISFDMGETWSISEYPNSSLNDITSVEEDVWVIGTINSVAVLLHTQGREAWKEIWKGSKDQFLTGVDFINANKGWIVGSNGLILHTMNSGQSWNVQQTPNEENLEDVAFADEMTGYAVGQHGIVLYTIDGGKTWVTQDSGTQVTLTNAIIGNQGEAWAVGQKGMVLFTNDSGRHWQIKDLKTRADIYAATVKNNNMWIATSDGTILHSSL
jgi:photosystem II stability/assembly factor-like uncharacterized protein